MIKIKSFPSVAEYGKEESGIRRVVEAYHRYLPDLGYEYVDKKATTYDLSVSHIASSLEADVVHTHGLYWTADYDASKWEWRVNAMVAGAVRQAKHVTVPSRWVQEVFQRDMRFSPHVVPHGIEFDEWQHAYESSGYVLWNKNRSQDVCSPEPVKELAMRAPQTLFVSTFTSYGTPPNVKATGLLPHAKMKKLVQCAGVYLSSTKETFGIGVLEAMASGVPVLGFANGGNMDLVQHGVNGYLAKPGDYDDLARGLVYCLQFRSTLGGNGRELAKTFTWEAAVEKLDKVYRLALVPSQGGVSVVIPSYNYADKVTRAIESAATQTLKADKIVVVDDGSPDDGATERVVSELMLRYDNLVYLRQDNAGVAKARNAGVGACESEYICCLDADDAIEPDYLKVCVDALKQDRSLGITYTGLRWIKPDGSTGISDWPGTYNYDAQIRRRNQIPTCCVFRKEMWKRLGGYRSRYAPIGAGSEDAEFWTRAGAYGYDARKVTEQALFIYSWQSGRVSGNRNYREIDWLYWHPWTRDSIHPFASMATPINKISHPVRQYDEPGVSVIIPVGKGHADKVIDALDSLDAQTYRRWEAIVVSDTDGEEHESLTKMINDVFPHVRLFHTGGKKGAGKARNVGAENARAQFLLFLDADDWLYPECIEKMLDKWALNPDIIYTDYVGKAYVSKEHAEKVKDRVLQFNEETGEAVIRHYSADYDCERAIQQPRMEHPYLWCLITSLVPKVWHNEIGGFDEKMPSWEDWDYWIRHAKAGRCFTRITDDLVVYRFYTGNRRTVGGRQWERLVEYLINKYTEVQTKMCNCGGRSTQTPAYRITPPRAGIQSTQEENMDNDMDLCIYKSNNRGQHKVVGVATGIVYGYRAGGSKFLVHKKDIERMPNQFERIKTVTVVEEKVAPPETPTSIFDEPTGIAIDREDDSTPETVQAILDDILETGSIPGDADMSLLPGVTPQILAQLAERGIATHHQLLEMGEDGLRELKGIGEVRAKAIIQWVSQQ